VSRKGLIKTASQRYHAQLYWNEIAMVVLVSFANSNQADLNSNHGDPNQNQADLDHMKMRSNFFGSIIGLYGIHNPRLRNRHQVPNTSGIFTT